MEPKSCHTYNPLCATLIFGLGCVLGTYFGHVQGIKHDAIVIGIAMFVFYVTQVVQPRLLLSKKKIK